MAIYGLGAFCGFAGGIASRYFHIRPELARAGLKTLAQGGFVGVAMQVAAVAVALQASQLGGTTKEKNKWFRFGYMTALLASISVLPPLCAFKPHYALPYKEVIATAALSTLLLRSALFALKK